MFIFSEDVEVGPFLREFGELISGITVFESDYSTIDSGYRKAQSGDYDIIVIAGSACDSEAITTLLNMLSSTIPRSLPILTMFPAKPDFDELLSLEHKRRTLRTENFAADACLRRLVVSDRN